MKRALEWVDTGFSRTRSVVKLSKRGKFRIATSHIHQRYEGSRCSASDGGAAYFRSRRLPMLLRDRAASASFLPGFSTPALFAPCSMLSAAS
jgi:hypothetical protein